MVGNKRSAQSKQAKVCTELIFGDDEPEGMLQILKHVGALNAESHDDTPSRLKNLKRASEVLRKIGTLPDYRKISQKRVAALAYLEFSFGRIESLTNQEKEVANRSEESVPLIYPDATGVAAEQLKKASSKVVQGCKWILLGIYRI